MEEDALLRAIVDRPAEAGQTWLVLADWLDEHGRHAQAELIRLQHQPSAHPDLDAAARHARIVELLLAGTRPCVPSFTDDAGQTFVWVGPGSFAMGSPTEEVGRSSDEKLHRVQITRGFWIGATPVTQAQWRAVLGADPSDFKGDDRPVENVTWDDCQEFCRVLQERTGRPYRLLTEAEWEYAARAGTTTPYFWGGHLTTDLANFNGAGNSYGGVSSGNLCRWTTTPVRMFFPNLWGLYDIHGNVWEWCEDWHAPYRARARVDPTGPETGQSRVLRGGSWLSPPTTCRTADRNRLTPENRNPYWGVRIAISGRPRQTESAEVFRDSVQKSRMGVTATRPEKHTSTSDPAERLRE